jgi:BON domain
MPQDYRPMDYRRRSERRELPNLGPRERLRSGEDRDRYESGGERRYRSEWDPRSSERGFEGDRSYPRSGYPEEFGYRHDYRADRLAQERRDLRAGRYSDFERLRWDQDVESPDYYGVGSHYGGGYGTAPSSRASGAGSWGDAGYDESGDWSERDDWSPESGGGVMSGSYESYGRSTYGAQSGYGRRPGQPVRSDYGGRRPRFGSERDAGADFSYSPQSFRGRGPKGYERSDERLKEMICERLTDDPRIDASEVSVEVTQKVVRLTGSVEDRRTKHAIEDLIDRCGVKDIDNQLRVQSGQQPPGSDYSAKSAEKADSPSAKRT